MQNLQAQNNRRYSNQNGGGAGASEGLSGPERLFGLVATSTTNAAANAILFGLARQGDAQNAGSGDGIAITGIGNVGHVEMKRLTAYTPYSLLKLRLWANAAATIPSSLEIRYRTAGGSKEEVLEVYPPAYLGSDTDDATRVELDFEDVIIDASFQITASIAANGTLRFFFVARAVTDQARTLLGKSAVVVNSSPAPATGSAQRIIVEQAGRNSGLIR